MFFDQDAIAYAELVRKFPQKTDNRWKPVKVTPPKQPEITIDLPKIIETLEDQTADIPVILGEPDMKIYLV